jgi:hypothetical protein
MRKLTVLASLACTMAMAQPAPVEVRLDSATIRIGEQVDLRINVVLGPTVQWPTIPDTLAPHVEVVRDLGVDTLDVDGTTRQVRRLRITSFDTGYHAIPPFHLLVGGHEVETEAMLLHVEGVKLDSTLTLHGIHDILPTPFSLALWLEDNWAWFVGGAVLVALTVLIARRPRRSPSPAPIPPTGPAEVPLHEQALQALQALERERLWQQGLHKEYHSHLTDILRSYIEQRFRVSAMEHPTDELLQDLRVSAMGPDQRTLLANILRLADLVKFAKALPGPHENEQVMASAIRFINETRPEPSQPNPSDAQRP